MKCVAAITRWKNYDCQKLIIKVSVRLRIANKICLELYDAIQIQVLGAKVEELELANCALFFLVKLCFGARV